MPKDYFNPVAGTVKIALSRVRAVTDRQGIILFNPGGPGGAAKSLVASKGDDLQGRVSLVST